MAWYVYILECVDGSLYTGVATDVKRRFLEHKNGRGARYTRSHKPRKIVYRKRHNTRSAAQKEEATIKRLSRLMKLARIRS